MRFTGYCFLFVFLLLINIPASAQDDLAEFRGYLITAQDDSLTGYFRSGDDYERSWLVQFREEGSETFRNYRPNQLYNYHINGIGTWYSVAGFVDGEGDLAFMMKLEARGPVNLYSAMVQPDRRIFLVRPPSGTVGTLLEDVYIDQLITIFGNCDEVLTPFNRAYRNFPYNTRGMLRAFSKFYDCERDGTILNPMDLAVQDEDERRQFKVGVWAGVNTGNFRVTGINNTYSGYGIDYVTGFTAGFYADFPLNIQRLYLRPEIVFTTRGGEAEIELPSFGFPERARIEADFYFVNIALPLRYEIPISGKGLYFLGGPLLGYLLHHDATVFRQLSIGEGGEETSESEDDLLDFYGNLNFGYNFGFGFHIPYRDYGVRIETRYTRTHLNLNDMDNAYRTTALEVMVGFEF